MRARLPLRLRVATAFSVTTAAALAGLGTLVYVGVEDTLLAQTRSGLRVQVAALGEVPPGRRPAAVAALDGPAFAQLLAPDGALVATSPRVRGPVLEAGELPTADGQEATVETGVRLTGQRELESAVLVARRYGDQVLVVGTSREDVADTLQEVVAALLVGGPLVLVLASVAGYLVAGAALRPIERLRLQAESISAQHAEERLSVPAAQDELRRLALTLNDMLDRLDQGLRRERRFVAEAGHELRTPLALLRTELELALARPRSPEELLAAVRSALEEVERLSRLSEDLLALASPGTVEATTGEVELGSLLRDVAGRFAQRAADHGRSLGVTGDFPLRAPGDADRLDRAVSNLVDNALRHGAGRVRLAARADGDRVLVEVGDEGAGADLGSDALDPFARASTSRAEGGHGLGLAIVRAVVAEHGGTVSVARGGPGRDTVVTLSLPGSVAAGAT